MDLDTSPTNIRGIEAYNQPPKGFNPSEASDEELARHGFPRRPPRDAHPAVHARFERFVQTRSQRIIPELIETDRGSRNMVKISEAATGARSAAATSQNWSGIVIVDNNNPFKKQGTQIVADWVVPRADCIYSGPGPCYSCHWVGIDGFGSADVLQGGTETDINCPGPGNAAPSTTYAWVEWFPQNQMILNNLAVSPGDDVSVSVYPSSIQPKGTVSILNRTTQQSAVLDLTPPPGVALVGNCVEWIVERTSINGQYATLAAYNNVVMRDCLALVYQTPTVIDRYFPGSAATGTIYNVAMVPAANPISVANVIALDPSLPDNLVFLMYY